MKIRIVNLQLHDTRSLSEGTKWKIIVLVEKKYPQGTFSSQISIICKSFPHNVVNDNKTNLV